MDWLALLNNPYVLVGIILASLLLVSILQPQRKGLPPIVSGFPIVGALPFFMKNPLGLVKSAYGKYGDVFTIKTFHKRLTFLVGPEASTYFFTARDEDMSQREVYTYAVPLFGKGVIYDVDTPTRYEQFKFLTGGLKTEALHSYVPMIVKETEEYFAEKWGDKEGVADIRFALADLIIMTASRCLLGKEIRENVFSEVTHLFQKLDEGLKPITIFAPNLPIKAHKERDRAREAMVELFHNILEGRRKNPDVKHNDVLQNLQDARYRDNTALTDQEITGLLIALLFAGQHTSSATSAWTGYCLLQNKQFLGPVLEEQKAVVKEFGNEITYDALEKMPKLHYAMKEALRLYPPLIFVIRQCHEDFAVRDMVVPKGDIVFVSPPISNRVDQVFPDPERFDPLRYEAPREEDKKFKFAHTGFGGGRHGCLGENFAYTQIKTIWSVIFRKYDLELVDPFPTPDYSTLVVGPSPCRVRYRLRK